MGVLLHSVHIALLVLGGIGVALLLRPDRPGHTRAVRALRAAAADGTLVALAERRASATLASSAPRPRPAALLYAVSFAAISVAVGLVANRIADGIAPPWWTVAILGTALTAIGMVVFARPAAPGRSQRLP